MTELKSGSHLECYLRLPLGHRENKMSRELRVDPPYDKYSVTRYIG